MAAVLDALVTGSGAGVGAAALATTGAATVAAVLSGSFATFASLVSFPRCFLRTSWRCFSRCFSSRRWASAARTAVHRSAPICASAEKSRPNENCVDRMIAANSSVRIRMIDPVLLK